MKSNIVLGLDIGSASCGWALVDTEKGVVLEKGARCFEEPLDSQGKQTTASIRGQKRRARKTLKRRKGRQKSLLKLFVQQGLLEDYSLETFLGKLDLSSYLSSVDLINQFAFITETTFAKWDWCELRATMASSPLSTSDQDGFLRALNQCEENMFSAYHDKIFFEDQGEDAWYLRVLALDEEVTPIQFVRILYHISRHRGFQSNRKGGKSSEGEVNKAIKSFTEEFETTQARTVAEFLQLKYADSSVNQEATTKRNKLGGYHIFPIRNLMRNEVDLLFKQQEQFGNEYATEAFLEKYHEIAFDQKPLQSFESQVGHCSLEGREEKRCSKYSPTFEYFRFLEQLTKREFSNKQTGESCKRWSPEYLKCLVNELFFSKTITETIKTGKIEKIIQKNFPNDHFEMHKVYHNTKEIDEVCRLTAWRAYQDFFTILPVHSLDWRKDWREKLTSPTEDPFVEQLHKILAFNEDENELKNQIANLQQDYFDYAIEDSVCSEEKFAKFIDKIKGVSHISLKAFRKLIPHMLTGDYYSEACGKEGYDYKSVDVSLEDVTNPLVRRIVAQVTKLLKAIVLTYETIHGPIKNIHIELAREAGKIDKKKNEETERAKANEKRKKDIQKEFLEEHGVELFLQRGDGIFRALMWKEQRGHCVFCLRYGDKNPWIEPKKLFELTDIEHVFPLSRSQDNSYTNKVMACKKCNSDKRNRTPFEWFGSDTEQWNTYAIEVRSLNLLSKEKRKRLLALEFKEDDFISRQLNDTRYACRLLIALLKNEVGKDIFGDRLENEAFFQARSGGLTAHLRKRWGVESLKKDEDGNRKEDDRHHALDAIVVALCSQGMMNYSLEQMKLEKEFQDKKRGLPLPKGWHSQVDYKQQREKFRCYIEKELSEVFVSRAPVRKARGEIHAETIYGKRDRYSLITVLDLKKCLKGSSEELIHSLWSFLIEQKWLVACDKEKQSQKFEIILNKDSDKNVLQNEIKKHQNFFIELGFNEEQIETLKDFFESKLAFTEYTQRVDLTRLKGKDIANLVDKKGRNQFLYDLLHQRWLEVDQSCTDSKKLQDEFSQSMQKKPLFYWDKNKKRNYIKSVTLSVKPARIEVRGGVANTGKSSLVRGDIFFKTDKNKTSYYLVPIYLYQMLNGSLPTETLTGIEIDGSFSFCFSLFPGDYFEILKVNATNVEGGYFCGVVRNNVRCYPVHIRKSEERQTLAIQSNVLSFKKYEIDYLGRKNEVVKEKRLWRCVVKSNNS